jgi:hypothetical protein
LVASLKISRALSYEEEVHKGLEYVPSGVEVPAPSNVTFSVVALAHAFDFVTSIIRVSCLRGQPSPRSVGDYNKLVSL